VTFESNSINNLQSAEEITADEGTGASASDHDAAAGCADDAGAGAGAPAADSAADRVAAAVDCPPEPGTSETS
jgi:hypothetical protein